MIQAYTIFRTKIVLILIIVLSVIGYKQVQGQNCGMSPGIDLGGGMIGGELVFIANVASLPPGYMVYQYDWVVNNVLVSSDDSLTMFLLYGYNQICLTVHAADPVTGDSCVSEHCNIFNSTANVIYPVLDVNINGLTVDFSIDFYNNTAGWLTQDFWIYYNDGTPMEWGNQFTSHTYAAAGDYNIIFGVSTDSWILGSTSSQLSQTIHVGTGTNMEVGWNFATPVNCDSIEVEVGTNITPSGVFYRSPSIQNNSVFLPGYGVGDLQLRNIPGQHYLSAEVWDGGSGADWQHNYFTIPECNIVPDTAHGRVYEDLNFNGICEPGEPGIAGQQIVARGRTLDYLPPLNFMPPMGAGERASYYVLTDSLGYFKIIMPHDNMIIICNLTAGQVLTYPGQNSYNTTYNSSNANYGPYNFGITNLSAQICGTVYMDDNLDSLYTLGVDRPIETVIQCLNTTSGLVSYVGSWSNGSYCINMAPGNFELTPINIWLDSAAVYPDTILVNGLTGGTYSNNDFGFSSPVQTNFHLGVYGTTTPRPGFAYTQSVSIYNSGSANSTGTVVMHYDTLFSSPDLTVPTGAVDSVNRTVTWITDSIGPGHSHNYHARFIIPASTPLGTIITNYASITTLPGFTDYVLINNSDTATRVVVGSYDPNDKTVHPSGTGAGGIVMPDTRLTYRIRFQNTGTASAINVFVTDTIHPDLDLNTLMMHGSSHIYSMQITNRVITWTFANINLPDSTTNLNLSSGFIDYSISPVANLPEGTVVTNSANIYFDFNEPVITNAAITTFQTTFVGLDEQHSLSYLEIFPQPAHDRCDLVLHDFPIGKGLISMVDLSGRLIKDYPVDINSKLFNIPIDLQSVAPGFYLINITSGQTRITERLIKF